MGFCIQADEMERKEPLFPFRLIFSFLRVHCSADHRNLQFPHITVAINVSEAGEVTSNQ